MCRFDSARSRCHGVHYKVRGRVLTVTINFIISIYIFIILTSINTSNIIISKIYREVNPYGVIPGLMIKKIPASFPRSLATVCVTQVICSLLLNTLWIYLFYGAGLSVVRFVGSVCSLGIYIVLFYLAQKGIARFSKTTLREIT